MKLLFSILFIFAMSADVTVSLVKQIQGRDMYEMTDMDTDDAEDGKKAEKEKESFTIYQHPIIEFGALIQSKSENIMVFSEDNLISECHVLMPELPPEA